VALSRRTFTRRFQSETGLTFSAWQRRACVLSVLARLLRGERVTTLAFDLGYSSPAAFAAMFKHIIVPLRRTADLPRTPCEDRGVIRLCAAKCPTLACEWLQHRKGDAMLSIYESCRSIERKAKAA
jgi:hypothetical protein